MNMEKVGSKVGTGEEQREIPVNFIFMTGHANYNNNIGKGKPKDQANLITEYCNAKGYYCLDYYSIDTHCMNDNYWLDSGDDGNSALYGGTGKFYLDYQNRNTIGNGYYENKNAPGGSVTYGAHNTQHITANRKAYAMWYILARLAGWDGKEIPIDKEQDSNSEFFYFDSEDNIIILLDEDLVNNAFYRLYNLTGIMVMQKSIDSTIISLSGIENGIYIFAIHYGNRKIVKKILVS